MGRERGRKNFAKVTIVPLTRGEGEGKKELCKGNKRWKREKRRFLNDRLPDCLWRQYISFDALASKFKRGKAKDSFAFIEYLFYVFNSCVNLHKEKREREREGKMERRAKDERVCEQIDPSPLDYF